MIYLRYKVYLTGGARKKTTSISSQDGRQQDNQGAMPSNTDPNIVQDQYKWTIHNASVNLPALLNDPRLVRRETDFFTKTWGQNFEKGEVIPSPYIPEIDAEHFEKYRRRVAVVSCAYLLSLVLYYLLTYAPRSQWSIGHQRPPAIALCSGLLLSFQTSWSPAVSALLQCLASSCCEAGLSSSSLVGSRSGLGVWSWMLAS